VPEGDTIFRAARTLHDRIGGRVLVSARAPRRPDLRPPPAGTRVDHVEARGKHLLIGFDDGSWLHTHMRMRGSWHTYRPGERWRRPGRDAVVVLRVPSAEAVCFAAPIAEMLTGAELVRHPQLRDLGPDLCAPRPDVDEALRRLDDLDPSTPIADALLDQRVASGIGNVYKSEACWTCRVEPAAPVGTIGPDLRRELLLTASTLLRRNLGGGPRRTYAGGLAVYGAHGRRCPRCATPIVSARLGRHARTTWWCPGCQATSA
jgi:endonuclease-8